MKISLLTFICGMVLSLKADGVVNFSNAGYRFDAPVVDSQGVKVGRTGMQVELWQLAGPNEVLLARTPLGTGGLSGYFFGGIVTVPGEEHQGHLRVRVVGPDGKVRGMSGVLLIQFTDEPRPPANLYSLTGIRLEDEVHLTIVQEGTEAVIEWERSGWELQRSQDLRSWVAVSGSTATTQVKVPRIATTEFFRLVRAP